MSGNRGVVNFTGSWRWRQKIEGSPGEYALLGCIWHISSGTAVSGILMHLTSCSYTSI